MKLTIFLWLALAAPLHATVPEQAEKLRAGVPTAATVSPSDGSLNVRLTDTLEVEFNQPVSVQNADSVRLINLDAAAAVTFTLDLEDSTLQIIPALLLAGTRYRVEILSDAVRSATLDPNNAFSFSFTTAPAPALKRVDPVAGSQNIATGRALKAVLTQPVTLALADSVVLSGGRVPIALNPSVTDSTVTFGNAVLEPGTLYTAILKPGAVRTAFDVPNPPLSWNFRTRYAIPAVVSTVPAPEATGVSRTADLKIRYNQPLSIVNAALITLTKSGGTPVTGLTVGFADSVLTISIPQLDVLARYTLNIPATALINPDNINPPPQLLSFTTVANALSVLQVQPADGVTKVDPLAAVRVVFDQDIRAGNLTGLRIQSESGQDVTNVSAQIADSILTIRHAPFEDGVRYTVTVPAGAVKNADGTPNPTAISWQFTTRLPAPAVLSNRPVDGAFKVTSGARVWVRFSQPVRIADSTGFHITSASGTDDQSPKPLVRGDTVELQHAGLLPGHIYVVTIDRNAVMNTDSVRNLPYDWAFTTVLPAPVITFSQPADSVLHMPLNPVLRYTWSGTVLFRDTSRIRLLDPLDRPVPGLQRLLIPGNRLEIRASGLAFGTRYTIRIDSGAVMNTDSIAADAFRRVFTTVQEPPALPALLSPAALDSAAAPDLRFTWTSSARALHYHLQVSRTEDFSVVDHERTELPDTTAQLYRPLDRMVRYFWRVRATNPGGESGWTAARPFNTAAETPVPVFPASGDSLISIAPVLRFRTGDGATSWRVQVSTQADFSSTVADTVVTATGAARTGLASGTVHYWRVRVDQASARSAWSNPARFETKKSPAQAEAVPAVRTFSFGATSDGARNPRRSDFRLIALPGNRSLRLDSVFTGAYRKTWRAFREPGGSGSASYVEFTADDPRFRFKPGNGFWVLGTREFPVSLDLPGVSLRKDDTYRVPLQPGWNILGNPFRTAVDWDLAKSINGITGELFGFNLLFQPATVMAPFTAYYYYNDPAAPRDSLALPYTGSDKKTGGATAAIDPAATAPQIELSAAFGPDLHSRVLVLLPAAGEAERLQPLEAAAPEVPSGGYGLTLHAAGSGPNSLFRAVRAYQQHETLAIRFRLAGETGSKIPLTARLTGLDPQNLLLLEHPLTGQFIPLSAGEATWLTLTEPVSEWVLHYGPAARLEELRGETPASFDLLPNYPNPFNPSTVIRYHLAAAGPVQLQVFDVSGRLVRTLEERTQQPGRYALPVSFDGMSSGVYVIRLRAGGLQFTRKAVLIR